jgi:hypothetical protein
MEGTVDQSRLKQLHLVNFTVVATGMALIGSAFVTAWTSGLTVYDGLIVLNLSWMNNITAYLYWIIVTDMTAGRISILRQSALYITHSSVMGAFGIWLFHRVDSFGSQPECTPTTKYYFAGP